MKVHEREDGRLTQGELEVFEVANVLLSKNLKRQVVEISDSLKWLKENKPGPLANIRAGAILKREEMLGYTGSVDGWSLKAFPKSFSLSADGDLKMTLNVMMRRGEEMVDVLDDVFISKNRDLIEVSTSSRHGDFSDQNSSREAKVTHASFFEKSSTVKHYASLAKTLIPLTKAKIVREMDAYVAPAKKLAKALSDEITNLDQTIVRQKSMSISRSR